MARLARKDPRVKRLKMIPGEILRKSEWQEVTQLTQDDGWLKVAPRLPQEAMPQISPPALTSVQADLEPALPTAPAAV